MSLAPTEEGRRLATLLQSTARLHLDVAALLETAAGLLQEDGFEVATEAVSFIDSSTAIHNPRHWMPREVFRCLISETRPTVLVAVVAFLANREEKERQPFDEPLVATTWFEFPEPVRKYNGKEWHLWYVQWHTWLGRVPNGEWARRTIDDYPVQEREKFGYRFKGLASRAVPLANIRDAETLRTHVTSPLLADLPAPQRGVDTDVSPGEPPAAPPSGRPGS